MRSSLTMVAPEVDTAPLLGTEKLSVTFQTPKGPIHAVREATLEIHRGEILGLVGESGSGKSTVAFAIMGYLPQSARIGGKVRFEGRPISEIPEHELRRLRGNRIAMVYQDPFTALNPSMQVGKQVMETLKAHLPISTSDARRRTAELFEIVHLPEPERLGKRYPHQLSGGMQQRVLIAMALACDPDLLLMDEPTTGLDVTTEATILDLVLELKGKVNAAVLFISHNLGVIARVADRVAVMYAGEIVEQGSVLQIFKHPRHPYTVGLLNSVPRPPEDDHEPETLPSIPGSVFDAASPNSPGCLFADRCPMARYRCRMEAPPLLATEDGHHSRCFYASEVRPGIWGEREPQVSPTSIEGKAVLSAGGLTSVYGERQRKLPLLPPIGQPQVRALVNVTLEVKPGRTLGIVGESGSGKTTLARNLVGLVPRAGGSITLRGKPLAPSVEKRDASQRAALRMIFQNPASSLNPRLRIRQPLMRSLRKFAHLSGRAALLEAVKALDAVGLDASFLDRTPGDLSGGQQQRVAMAIALSAKPDILVADEAVSALDVSVQAQVLNLLLQHQREAGTAYIFISHDLGVVRYISDDIMVLYAGHVAEFGPFESVLRAPSHPYTEALLSAVPLPDPEAPASRIRLEGNVPSLRQDFKGCFFASRCPRKMGWICDEVKPPEQRDPVFPEHMIACHIPWNELKSPGPVSPGHNRAA